MATEDNFIVAIELGSSKVTAIAGRKQPDGAIQVLAFAVKPSDSFVRKGRINNVTKMTECISSIKKDFEEKLQKGISRVYVGLGGMGMHTVGNTISRHFGQKTTIEQSTIESILDANLASPVGDRVILEAVPQEYKLGTQITLEPVGIPSESIEGTFLNVIAGAGVGDDIRSCFMSAGLGLAGMPITVEQLADAILADGEKRSGCAFIDMGAETTSVAVYKSNILRHLAVIPLGGANINRDIANTLQIEDDEAEMLKRKYGVALRDESATDHAPIALRDGRSIPYEEFAGLVEARTEEIILNIGKQIELSKNDKNKLIGGIVVTGGASQLKGTDKAFEQHIGFEKVRFVKNLRLQVRGTGKDFANFNTDGSYNAALAIIDQAEINCCGGDLGTASPGIFDPIEQKKQEELQRREQEAAAEAERIAREKAEEEERQRRAAEEAERRANRFKGIKTFIKRFADASKKMVSEEDYDPKSSGKA